ncbi:hypothetical protein [Actinophytocola sp.]|uniref:hypothetical protein n=1 Tax=Actinophytocola sp. TaxID=1872138 RepID=UPI002ED04E4D
MAVRYNLVVRVVVALLGFAATTAVSASPAAASPDAGRAAPAGTVTYVEQGHRTDKGTCRFESEGERHVDDGAVVLYFTELAYDPATCVRRMARAEYRPDEVPPAIARQLAAGSSKEAAGQHRAESGQRGSAARPGVQAVIPYTMTVQVWWEDPVYIDLTMTRSTLGWAYSTPDLLLYGPSYHEAYWYWFDASGWKRDHADYLFYDDGANTGTNTVGRFSNSSFYLPVICDTVGGTTYADHALTYAWASNYGYFGYSLYSEKSGNCADGMYGSYIVTLA